MSFLLGIVTICFTDPQSRIPLTGAAHEGYN